MERYNEKGKYILCICSAAGGVGLAHGRRSLPDTVFDYCYAGSDVAVFSGEGRTDADGYFKCVLVDSDQAIGDAFIESLTLKINSDPEVGIEFGVRAGASATPFHILSDVVEFSPMVNPTASAMASVTLTDRSPAGATITGLFPGGKTHQARYNSSAVFANLVNSFSIPSGTLTKEEANSLSGSETINDTLSSIESESWFRLSAKDSAAGTSNFVVEEVQIPEPATICLLGFGAIVLRKKL